MRTLTSLICGLIFGAGLILSGMGNPAKIQNFLDIFGQWDPSLLFVMGGAIAVTLPGYRLVMGRGNPLFDSAFHLPTRTDLDARLLGGALVFGIGWGISGYCPGPALTALPIGGSGTVAFVIAMLLGMMAARLVTTRPVAGTGLAR